MAADGKVGSWARGIAGKCGDYANEGFGGFHMTVLSNAGNHILLLEWLNEQEVGSLDLPAGTSLAEAGRLRDVAAEIVRAEASVNVYTTEASWKAAMSAAGIITEY